MKGRTNKGFPNREQDMEYVQTSRSVRHEGLFDGKHVGIQGRGIGAASLYADSLFVFRRNRPVRTRTPGGAGPGLALRGQSGDPIRIKGPLGQSVVEPQRRAINRGPNAVMLI